MSKYALFLSLSSAWIWVEILQILTKLISEIALSANQLTTKPNKDDHLESRNFIAIGETIRVHFAHIKSVQNPDTVFLPNPLSIDFRFHSRTLSWIACDPQYYKSLLTDLEAPRKSAPQNYNHRLIGKWLGFVMKNRCNVVCWGIIIIADRVSEVRF